MVDKSLEQEPLSARCTDADQETLKLARTLFADFESIYKNVEQLLPSGVSCTEAHVLFCVTTASRITVSALAGRLGVSAGWASRVSGQLLSKGLLKCSRDANDRRLLHLSATEAALDIVERVYGTQQELSSAALRQMGPSEQAVVASFLERIAARSNEMRQADFRIPQLSVRSYVVRELWRNRPSTKQKLDDVPEFYRWLEKNRPRLLNRKRDPFSNLLSDLDLENESASTSTPNSC